MACATSARRAWRAPVVSTAPATLRYLRQQTSFRSSSPIRPAVSSPHLAVHKRWPEDSGAAESGVFPFSFLIPPFCQQRALCLNREDPLRPGTATGVATEPSGPRPALVRISLPKQRPRRRGHLLETIRAPSSDVHPYPKTFCRHAPSRMRPARRPIGRPLGHRPKPTSVPIFRACQHGRFNQSTRAKSEGSAATPRALPR